MNKVDDKREKKRLKTSKEKYNDCDNDVSLLKWSSTPDSDIDIICVLSLAKKSASSKKKSQIDSGRS